MAGTLHKIIGLPGLLRRFSRSSKKQKQFLNETILIEIESLKKEPDNQISDEDVKKIMSYYGWAVPAILGEAFSLLRGKPITKNERIALTNLGALTGLFDDLFDQKAASSNHILNMMNNPDEEKAKNNREKLFIRFVKTAMNFTPNTERIQGYAARVFQAQIDSYEQENPEITTERIEEITKEKGGTSLLFYRSAFADEISPEEEIMLYELGGLGQLENDIFDIFKDLETGIHTIPNQTKQISKLRADYKQKTNQVFDLISKTSFPQKNKDRFRLFVSLVLCRGFVCLDYLEKAEKTSNGIFSPKSYNRKQLICDMEKMGSTLKLLRYHLKS